MMITLSCFRKKTWNQSQAFDDCLLLLLLWLKSFTWKIYFVFFSMIDQMEKSYTLVFFFFFCVNLTLLFSTTLLLLLLPLCVNLYRFESKETMKGQLIIISMILNLSLFIRIGFVFLFFISFIFVCPLWHFKHTHW